MEDTNLPPSPDGMNEISERLQEYNQKVQEQAFLLGYRNGFREGDLVKGLVRTAQEKQADAERESTRLAWQEVEHWLVQNGAFLDEDRDEVTHPPGLLFYVGAFEAQPFVQVAGERIHIEDLEFQWDPDHASEGDPEGFEPHGESGQIELEFTMDLPEDSDQREELMQFLEGLR